MSICGRLAVITCCMLLSAACAPSSFPRVAEVAQPGKVRMLASLNVAYSQGKARTQTPADVKTKSLGARMQNNVAGANFNDGAWTGLFFPLWLEYQGAVGLFDPCELGGSFSIVRVSAEMRCELWQTAHDHPFGIALGTALLHHTVFGTDVGLPAFQWRSTLEFSGSSFASTPIVNFVVSYGRVQRHLGDNFSVDNPARGVLGSFGGFVTRDEWKLAVPIGYLFNWSGTADGVIVGLVPEWTLHAADPKTKCVGCTERISQFEQHFAIFFTVGLHGMQE